MISTVPFLTTGSWVDAVRATALMGIVAGVYYWRAQDRGAASAARTRPIGNISEWMERNGLVPRFFRWLQAGKRHASACEAA